MDNNRKEKLTPKELIYPMVNYRDDGVPLQPAMDFFDAHFDSIDSMPPPTPLSIEYYISLPPKNKISEELLPQELSIHTVARSVDKEKPKSNDTDNAYSIKEIFLSRISLVVIKEKFYLYSGKGYQKKTQKDIERKIVSVCRDRIKSKPPQFVNSVADFIIKEPRVYVLEENLPRNFVSFKNGVLDIETGELFNHSPNFLTLYEINGNYLGCNHTQTPIFDKFLFDITGGDLYLIERILQIIGYTLTPDIKGKCLFLFQGVGNSGKSVLTNLIIKLFNTEACLPLDIKLFSGKFTTSNLINIALCTVPDLPSSPIDDVVVSKLKQLTGNDVSSSDVKFGDVLKFIPSSKFLLATNHAFLTKTKDEAFEYRVVVIPFKYSVKKENQDFKLEEKLLQERDGIISKSIAAYFRLKQNDYIFSGTYNLNETISEVNDENTNLETAVFNFIRRNFVREAESIVFIDDVYSMFLDTFGFVHKNIFSEHFTRYVEEIYDAEKTRKRKTGTNNPISAVKGITLKL